MRFKLSKTAILIADLVVSPLAQAADADRMLHPSGANAWGAAVNTMIANAAASGLPLSLLSGQAISWPTNGAFAFKAGAFTAADFNTSVVPNGWLFNATVSVGLADNEQRLSLGSTNGSRVAARLTQSGVGSWRIGMPAGSSTLVFDPTSSSLTSGVMSLTTGGVLTTTILALIKDINLGNGNSDPGGPGNAQLVISGATNPNQKFTITYDTTNNKAVMQAAITGSAVEPIIMNPSGGNIGMGTWSPSAKLDVAGTALVEGSATFNGTITAASLTTAANCSGQPSGNIIATTGTGALIKCP